MLQKSEVTTETEPSMKNTILILLALVVPSLGQAAITSDYECADHAGAEIIWEVQLTSLDPIREGLYNNRMRVIENGEEVIFTPDRVVLGKKGRIHATSKDGQFISVGALQKTGEREEYQFYSGTIEYKLKTKAGKVIKRNKGTAIICGMHGEA